jgi:hypothetical protein
VLGMKEAFPIPLYDISGEDDESAGTCGTRARCRRTKRDAVFQPPARSVRTDHFQLARFTSAKIGGEQV